jgi:hypothetical protein
MSADASKEDIVISLTSLLTEYEFEIIYDETETVRLSPQGLKC